MITWQVAALVSVPFLLIGYMGVSSLAPELEFENMLQILDLLIRVREEFRGIVSGIESRKLLKNKLWK